MEEEQAGILHFIPEHHRQHHLHADLGPDLQAKAVASDDTTAAVIEKEGVVAGDPRYSGSYDPQKRGPTDEDEEEEEADDEEDDKKSKKKKVTCGPVNSNCNAVEKDSTGRDD